VIELVWGSSFRRAYKKIIKQNPQLKEKLAKSLKIFQKEPFHPTLKTHKLSGELIDLYAFSIGYDCRVVFKFMRQDEALLITLGPHDKVY
jgi:mRNA interferase YafQ